MGHLAFLAVKVLLRVACEENNNTVILCWQFRMIRHEKWSLLQTSPSLSYESPSPSPYWESTNINIKSIFMIFSLKCFYYHCVIFLSVTSNLHSTFPPPTTQTGLNISKFQIVFFFKEALGLNKWIK